MINLIIKSAFVIALGVVLGAAIGYYVDSSAVQWMSIGIFSIVSILILVKSIGSFDEQYWNLHVPFKKFNHIIPAGLQFAFLYKIEKFSANYRTGVFTAGIKNQEASHNRDALPDPHSETSKISDKLLNYLVFLTWDVTFEINGASGAEKFFGKTNLKFFDEVKPNPDEHPWLNNILGDLETSFDTIVTYTSYPLLKRNGDWSIERIKKEIDSINVQLRSAGEPEIVDRLTEVIDEYGLTVTAVNVRKLELDERTKKATLDLEEIKRGKEARIENAKIKALEAEEISKGEAKAFLQKERARIAAVALEIRRKGSAEADAKATKDTRNIKVYKNVMRELMNPAGPYKMDKAAAQQAALLLTDAIENEKLHMVTGPNGKSLDLFGGGLAKLLDNDDIKKALKEIVGKFVPQD